jgi:hypothetical protein
MENEKRIVELLAESLLKFDEMIDEQKITNKRLEKVESEIIKLNLQTGENSRAIFKLADEVEKIADLHERVNRLEKAVYK